MSEFSLTAKAVNAATKAEAVARREEMGMCNPLEVWRAASASVMSFFLVS